MFTMISCWNLSEVFYFNYFSEADYLTTTKKKKKKTKPQKNKTNKKNKNPQPTLQDNREDNNGDLFSVFHPFIAQWI